MHNAANSTTTPSSARNWQQNARHPCTTLPIRRPPPSSARNWQQNARHPCTTLPIRRPPHHRPGTGSRTHATRAQRCQFDDHPIIGQELAAERTPPVHNAANSTTTPSSARNWQQNARHPCTTLPIRHGRMAIGRRRSPTLRSAALRAFRRATPSPRPERCGAAGRASTRP